MITIIQFTIKRFQSNVGGEEGGREKGILEEVLVLQVTILEGELGLLPLAPAYRQNYDKMG